MFFLIKDELFKMNLIGFTEYFGKMEKFKNTIYFHYIIKYYNSCYIKNKK